MTTHAGPAVAVEEFAGDRAALRPLFALAEDSEEELRSYLPLGRVLVARDGAELVGHLQLIDTGTPGEAELKSLAVRADQQGHGVGSRLVAAARALLAEEGLRVLLVSTATASVDNLRFYQRRGFRMVSIERDAFTSANGYPPGIEIDGIPLRDRVWLDMAIAE